MESAALQRIPEMKKFIKLLLPIDTEDVPALQMSLDALIMFGYKKRCSKKPETTPLRASIFGESVVTA